MLGISPSSDNTAIRTIMEGLLPGVKMEKYSSRFVNSLNYSKQEKDRYVGCISGIPALKIEGEHQYKDISALMRSLNGQSYTVMILCRPVSEKDIQEKINHAIHIRDGCAAISKRSLSLQKGESDSNTHTEQHGEADGTFKSTGFGIGLSGGIMGMMLGLNFNKAHGTSHSVSSGYSDAFQKTISENQSVSFDMQNGFAVELMKMADTAVERLKTGRSIGLWESVVSYSSDNALLYNSDIENKFFNINISMLHNHLSQSIDAFAFRTLITLLYQNEPQELYEKLQNACDSLKSEAVQNNLTLTLGTDLKECILQCIFESAVCLMLSRILKGSQLPSKQMTAKLKETISSPSEIKISELQQYFESYYNKLPRKKAEETIMLLLGKNLCSEQEIREFILI